MIKNLFKKGPKSKFDVAMACAAALVGVWKAIDTIRDYKSENQENKK